MFSESDVCPGTRAGPASSARAAAGHAVRVKTLENQPLFFRVNADLLYCVTQEHLQDAISLTSDKVISISIIYNNVVT